MDLVASSTPRASDAKPDIHSTHSITIQKHRSNEEPPEMRRPPLLHHVSSPAYNSPLRHHHRNPSTPRQVKESLDARSEYVTSQDDGVAEHRINQYIIKQEIGRGSFGAVHLAVDQYGHEYAVKEFSKARLRKRAQSHILRKPPAARRGGKHDFNSPLHRAGIDSQNSYSVAESAIDLIKQEIAIMKKLNHPNLVSLIEVLDDPTEDSLYMVMEMCKKGVVMRVDLEHTADPYEDSLCRYWFRDLILGIEYLHAQGVVHRDIKPDNCLITQSDVLKVVDFGVSEMFEKDSEMKTAKSAGSPAFLPPELCRARHGDVSGKAADIWSMGVTLYCLKFGQIPFAKDQIMQLYESIQQDQPDLRGETDPNFVDLMQRVLEKDPEKRIKMHELRQHAWVTQDGTDPLLPEAENTAFTVEAPTEAEMNAAITDNMRSLMTVVKAVSKFKALTANKRPPQMASILGDHAEQRFSQPPEAINKRLAAHHAEPRARSMDIDNRNSVEQALVAEGVHRDVGPKFAKLQLNTSTDGDNSLSQNEIDSTAPPLTTEHSEDYIKLLDQLANGDQVSGDESKQLPPFRPKARTQDELGHRGHAHNPLEDHLYLNIGPSSFAGYSTDMDGNTTFDPDDDVHIVSESPGAADMDIYETAYRDEIERILARAQADKTETQVYLTRRVDAKLLAISGAAGKWMAVGEESLNQLKDYTQFSARKAKVTEVSRALRQAAKDEYEKHRQEHRAFIAAAKAEKAKQHQPSGSPHDVEIVESPSIMTPHQMRFHHEDIFDPSKRAEWKGKAVERGRQAAGKAATSLMGIVDMVNQRRAAGR